LNILPVWFHRTLPLSQPRVLLGFDTGRLALGYEMPVGFHFTQDAAHLHHFLKTAQERILRFTFM
jgi:hypothetical protein